MNSKNNTCPKWEAVVITEISCPECDGLGHEDHGDENICLACGGTGDIKNEWECFECGHEWKT